MEKKKLLQIIYKYGSAITLLGAIIGAIVCYVIAYDTPMTNPTLKSQLNAIGTNLISSLIFAAMFNFFSNRPLLNIFKEEKYQNNEKLTEYVTNVVSKLPTKYYLDRIYPGSQTESRAFNEDITNDINTSRSYSFKGGSAKYVSPRVRYIGKDLRNITLNILSPLNDECLHIRASDRSKNPRYKGKSVAQLKNELQYEIYSSIVALFDLKCKIDVSFSADACVTRLEIFDNSLYLSLYNSEESKNKNFPETFRYNKDSIYYEMFSSEIFRQSNNIAMHKIFFDNRSTEEHLHEALKKCGMKDVTDGKIGTIRQENANFEAEFVKRLEDKKL